MYWDIEVTPEEEDQIIRKIAQKIHEYDFDMVAILMMESVKPVSFIGTQMGRFFFSPFLPAFGEEVGIGGEKFLQTFEKKENVEKVIKAVEEMNREDEEKKKAEKTKNLEKASKKGWRRFLPF